MLRSQCDELIRDINDASYRCGSAAWNLKFHHGWNALPETGCNLRHPIHLKSQQVEAMLSQCVAMCSEMILALRAMDVESD